MSKLLGTVIYRSNDSRYFFVKRDDGEKDLYLGSKEIQMSGLAPPSIGDRLRFDVKVGSGGLRAVEIERAA